jgi:hypothetical protein
MTRVHVFVCTGCGWVRRISEENWQCLLQNLGPDVSCNRDGIGCGYLCVEDRVEVEDEKGNVTAVIV